MATRYIATVDTEKGEIITGNNFNTVTEAVESIALFNRINNGVTVTGATIKEYNGGKDNGKIRVYKS